eukprot:gnl/TRDRNA2_/TRDRNA2_137548_c1_seq1.p1 gnl/TRDRNA2_/TRDRNA2_137548_c1~~gnl/TRDRNA2_/TRDRNA2_137548_c1_seq1.p1  ORF type:complete len:223 (-),score=38.89 gnl/TRDRNA2_/TRDRNA2_137548_c1_seq1:20-664(-)
MDGELANFRACLKSILELSGSNPKGPLSAKEIEPIFKDPRFRRGLQAFDVNCGMPFQYLWPIIDWDNKGLITFNDLMEACLRLRGSTGKHNFQVILLQRDMNMGLQALNGRIDHIEQATAELKLRRDARWARLSSLLGVDLCSPDPNGSEVVRNCKAPAASRQVKAALHIDADKSLEDAAGLAENANTEQTPGDSALQANGWTAVGSSGKLLRL